MHKFKIIFFLFILFQTSITFALSDKGISAEPILDQEELLSALPNEYSWLWKGFATAVVIIFLFTYRFRKINRLNQELQLLNMKLKESEDSFRYLVNAAHEGICVVQNKKLVYVNPRMSEMTGYDEESLLNLDNFLPLIAPEAREMIMANHQKRLAGKASPVRYESQFLKRDGTIYPIELTGVLINWNNSPATMNIVSDISERKASEEAIRFMALHDNLTRLPNRYLLMERLERSLALAKRSKNPLGILFMDLNGFKQINDTYGHDVGDMLLKAVTERIQKLMRDSDTLARMGGDEFVILLPQVDGPAGIETLIERIQDSFHLPFKLDTLEVKSHASVGFSLFPDHGNTVEELLNVADKNMYKIKHSKTK